MSNNVTGKNAKLWKNAHTTADGREWHDYAISLSKKLKDGSYENMSMRVRFSQECEPPRQIPSGAMMDYHGFLTLDMYKDKQGEIVKRPMIFITEVKFHDLYPREDYGDTGYAEVDEDVPF